MPTHTYNEVIQEINDISTNTQNSNKACIALGVNCQQDSSLADLSTNIGLIDTNQHPDYELPWVMADGSSGFLLPIEINKNTSVLVQAALMQAADNNPYLAGCTGYNMIYGLNQMTLSVRGRTRLSASPGNARDVNNYAGLNNKFSDTDCPYWKLCDYRLSWKDNEHYVSLYQVNEWIHSATSQNSTSDINNYPLGILAIPNISNASTFIFPNVTNNALKGTLIAEVGTSSSSYTSDYRMWNPVLHWDPKYMKYRPAYRAYGPDTDYPYRYSTFPLDSSVDNGNDHMYYIPVNEGYSLEIGSNNSTIHTDIKYDRSNTVIVNFYAGGTYPSFTSPNYNKIISRGSTETVVLRNVTYNQTNQGTSYYYNEVECRDYGSNSLSMIYQKVSTASQVQPLTDFTVGQNYSSSSNNCFIGTIPNELTFAYWTKTNKSVTANTGTIPDNQTLNFHVKTAHSYINWIRILDSNNNLIHSLWPCMVNNTQVLYDVVTKTTYST